MPVDWAGPQRLSGSTPETGIKLAGTARSVLNRKESPMFIITFESGMTTTMTAEQLIASKAWLLSIGAEWERIS